MAPVAPVASSTPVRGGVGADRKRSTFKPTCHCYKTNQKARYRRNNLLFRNSHDSVIAQTTMAWQARLLVKTSKLGMTDRLHCKATSPQTP